MRVLRWDLPAWGFLFSISVLIGTAAAIALAAFVRVPKFPMMAASICGVLSMVVLAFLTKIVTGDEVYNFHHYLIAVISATGLALWLMGQPLLRNLDIVVLGIGVTYACGRVACLRGGCCYGRPFGWGVSYSSEYADYGFPVGLVDVKLFPSQFIESFWMLLTIAFGVACLVRGAQPGSALAWFIVLYLVGRFFSDFYRLEAGFCVRGLSEAQIASIVMTCVVFAGEQMALLPSQPIHGAAALLLIIVGVPRLLSRSDHQQLFTTNHVIEIANAVKRANHNGIAFSTQTSGFESPNLPVERTSLGLLISAGTICTRRGPLIHYCVSREGTLRDSTAEALAKLISVISGRPGEESLIKRSGMFHVIIGGPHGDLTAKQTTRSGDGEVLAR